MKQKLEKKINRQQCEPYDEQECNQIQDEECSEENEEHCETIEELIEERVCSNVPGRDIEVHTVVTSPELSPWKSGYHDVEPCLCHLVFENGNKYRNTSSRSRPLLVAEL